MTYLFEGVLAVPWQYKNGSPARHLHPLTRAGRVEEGKVAWSGYGAINVGEAVCGDLVVRRYKIDGLDRGQQMVGIE